jgi:capsular polysaccharide export protein
MTNNPVSGVPSWARDLALDEVTMLPGLIDPWPLLEAATTIYAAPHSDVFRLAHLLDKRVHELGGAAASVRGLEERVADILLRGVAYRNPFSREEATLEDTLSLLAMWRLRLDLNQSIGAATGIAGWKRRNVSTMLWSGGRELPVHRRASSAAKAAKARNGALMAWPARAPKNTAQAAAAAGVSLASIEDGFIRSTGLGSDCVPPLSVVVDGAEPHYDSSGHTRLERLIEGGDFGPPLISRAERLIARLVDHGIGKYAHGRAAVPRPQVARVVLVTGQVEDDQSVQLGGGQVQSNLELLRRSRAAEPEAHILFRPHPDVEAGHRRGHVPDPIALQFVDAVERDAPLAGLLDMVDAVHVLTSLSGFEALLRGREVVVHGGPFFAGWGLTRDLGAPFRTRTRRASLAELVAATLIEYPHYLDPVTGIPCPVEVLVDRIEQGWEAPTSWLTRLRKAKGRLQRQR